MSQIQYQDVAGFSTFFQHKCFDTYAKNPDGFEDGVLSGRVKPNVFLQNVLGVLNFADIKRPVNIRPAVKEGLSDILTYLQDPSHKLVKLRIAFKDNPFITSIGSTDVADKVELISVPQRTRLAVAKKVEEVSPQEAEVKKMTLPEARVALADAFPLEVVKKFETSFRDPKSSLLGNKALSLYKIILDTIYPYLHDVLKDEYSPEQIHRKLGLLWHPDRNEDSAHKEILEIYFTMFEFLWKNMKEEDKDTRITKAEFEKTANRRLKYKKVDSQKALDFFEGAKNFVLQTRRLELVGLNYQNIDDYLRHHILTEEQFYAFFGLFDVAPRMPDVASKDVTESYNSLIGTAESLEELKKNTLYNYAFRKTWDNALLKFIVSDEMRSKVTFVTFLYCAKAIQAALQAEKSIQPKKFKIELDIWDVAEKLHQKFSDYSKKSHKEKSKDFTADVKAPLPIKKPPTLPPRPKGKGVPLTEQKGQPPRPEAN